MFSNEIKNDLNRFIKSPLADNLFMRTVNYIHSEIDQCEKYYFGDRLKAHNYIPKEFYGQPAFIGKLSITPNHLPILVEYIELYKFPEDESRTDKSPKRAILLTKLPYETIRITTIYYMDIHKMWIPGPFSYYMLSKEMLRSKELAEGLYGEAVEHLYKKGITHIPTDSEQFRKNFAKMPMIPMPQSSTLMDELKTNEKLFNTQLEEENQDIAFLNAALILLNDPTRFEGSESIEIIKE